MKILPFNKQPPPLFTEVRKNVGDLDLSDGLVDIVDPGYDRDVWCGLFDNPVKPGKYKCYITIINLPQRVKYEANDELVKKGERKLGEIADLPNEKVYSIVIEHEDATDIPSHVNPQGWQFLSSCIGVDSGLCGFYNHKPDFEPQEKWEDFLKQLPKSPKNGIICDVKPRGFTASSGFGDGMYTVYKYTNSDGEIIALKLYFG